MQLISSRNVKKVLANWVVAIGVAACAGHLQCSARQIPVETRTPAPARAPGSAYLGILYTTGGEAARDPYARLRGARIVEVLPQSPAERAGLRIGDMITSANGEPITGGDTLKKRIRTMQPGDTLRLIVIRPNGSREIVPALLESIPPEFAHRNRE